jgi:hypothetical protein
MHEGGAVQHLDRSGGGIGQDGIIHAAGGGGGEAQPGANPRATGKNGMLHGSLQPLRCAHARRRLKMGLQRLFGSF